MPNFFTPHFLFKRLNYCLMAGIFLVTCMTACGQKGDLYISSETSHRATLPQSLRPTSPTAAQPQTVDSPSPSTPHQ